MLARLLVALGAGAAIGFERSYHGRPAGFRTHALVCTASSLLMLVTVYEGHWMRAASALVQLDPTRMGQGIMTGIGFLAGYAGPQKADAGPEALRPARRIELHQRGGRAQPMTFIYCDQQQQARRRAAQ